MQLNTVQCLRLTRAATRLYIKSSLSNARFCSSGTALTSAHFTCRPAPSVSSQSRSFRRFYNSPGTAPTKSRLAIYKRNFQQPSSLTAKASIRYGTTSSTSPATKIEAIRNPEADPDAAPTSLYDAPITSPQDPNELPTVTSSSRSETTSRTPETELTWTAFLPLRLTRRRYNLLSSLSCSVLTTTAGISVLSNTNLESTPPIFGLDPFIILGLSTFASGAIGWLLGPFLGNAVFNLRYSRLRPQIEGKERDLYARIKKLRGDPSGSSAGNPVPDYYGEKIGSVTGYRTWLRDQRAYKKKKKADFL